MTENDPLTKSYSSCKLKMIVKKTKEVNSTENNNDSFSQLFSKTPKNQSSLSFQTLELNTVDKKDDNYLEIYTDGSCFNNGKKVLMEE